MGITDEDRKAIVNYRIEKAFATLQEAKDVLRLEHLSLCANRLYYASFYMASALLIHDGLSAQTHAGVLRLIGLKYVKEGTLTPDVAKLLNRLFSMRQEGDYGDIFDYEFEEIEPFIEKVESLLYLLKAMIDNH